MDEVARWLVESAHLPQYEQAFRDHEVDGDVLLDLVANRLLGHLVENPLHQSRIRAAVAKFARRASASAGKAVVEAAGEGAGPGGEDERPRQRRRLEEPASAEPAVAASLPSAAAALAAPLVAVQSPTHGTLVYARRPLADLEVRAETKSWS